MATLPAVVDRALAMYCEHDALHPDVQGYLFQQPWNAPAELPMIDHVQNFLRAYP